MKVNIAKYVEPYVHVDCQPKLSQPPQGQAPERSSGAVGSLDCAEMPNKGEGLVNC